METFGELRRAPFHLVVTCGCGFARIQPFAELEHVPDEQAFNEMADGLELACLKCGNKEGLRLSLRRPSFG